MLCDYGYLRLTEGVDGDHHDVFLGPHDDARFAHVINQMKPPDFGKLDEQKTMLCFESAEEAKRMYLAYYDDPRFFSSMKAMPMEEFKRKVLATLPKGAPAAPPDQSCKELQISPRGLRDRADQTEAHLPYSVTIW